MKDAVGSVQSALLLGAGSDIAMATARALVADRTRTVVMAARKPERLQPFANELRSRGAATVDLVEFDAEDLEGHAACIGDVFDRHGDLDVILVAFGLLGDQELAARDPATALGLMHTNLLGGVSVMMWTAKRLCEQGHGSIVVLSSVAAERARRSNFVYGASKAGLDAFAQGLGDRLHGTGVHVMVVRPGFVRTKMTRSSPVKPLAVSPDTVARAIVEGIRRDADVVWVPPALRYLMSALRHLPRSAFRRLEI